MSLRTRLQAPVNLDIGVLISPLMASLVLLPAPLSAQTLYFDGAAPTTAGFGSPSGSYLWSDQVWNLDPAGNGTSVRWTAGAAAILRSGTPSYDLELQATYTIRTQAITFVGGTVNITGGRIWPPHQGTLTLTAAGSAVGRLNSNVDVARTETLTKTGTGEVILTGSMSLNGPVAINEGTLQLGGLESFHELGRGNIILSNSSNLVFGAIGGPFWRGNITAASSGATLLQKEGVLTLTGNVSVPTVLVENSALTIGSGNQGTLSGNVELYNGHILFRRADHSTFDGNIQSLGARLDSLTQISAGTLTLTGYVGVDEIFLNSGALQVGNGGATGNLFGNVTFDRNTKLIFDHSGAQTFTGYLNSTYRSTKLVKRGPSTLTLTQPQNAFAGDTDVEEGTLALGFPFLSSSSVVSISSGAILDLAQPNVVGSFVLGGKLQAPGLWGSLGNPSATFKTAQITGSGLLSVTSGSYLDWANYYQVGAASRVDDSDGDGTANALEFVFGSHPAAWSPLAVNCTRTPTHLTITFPRTDLSEANGVVLKVQHSAGLTAWTDIPIGATSGTSGTATITIEENGIDDDTITVTIPVGMDGQRFCRVTAAVN